MEFLATHGVGLFDSRDRLKYALGKYAEHRATGPVADRFAATTWGRHMSVLSLFYRWAIAEGHAEAEPFTYRSPATTCCPRRATKAILQQCKPNLTPLRSDHAHHRWIEDKRSIGLTHLGLTWPPT